MHEILNGDVVYKKTNLLPWWYFLSPNFDSSIWTQTPSPQIGVDLFIITSSHTSLQKQSQSTAVLDDVLILCMMTNKKLASYDYKQVVCRDNYFKFDFRHFHCCEHFFNNAIYTHQTSKLGISSTPSWNITTDINVMMQSTCFQRPSW